MRALALIPLIAVAGCGGDGGGEAGKEEVRGKAASIAAGQWELTSEVTAFRTIDGGTPQIDAPVGTRVTETVCVGEGRPPTELFAGEGYRCSYDNYYVRNGRLNVTLLCRRDDLAGSIPMTTDGRFEEDMLEYTRDVRTSLAGPGDVQITASVTGRRTGDCPPEAEDGNQSASKAG